MTFRASLRRRIAPASAVVLVLASSAVASGAVAERPAPRVHAASAAPGSFTARATGVVRRGMVKVTVRTWNAEGRPLRGMRVTVRVARRETRTCGRTNRRGGVACRVPVRRARPAVYVAARSGRAVRVRFWRYSD